MRSTRSYLLGIILFLACVSGFSQVTTNGASGLAPTYPSLADAISALNAAVISAPIIIEVNADQTAPSGGYIITAQGTAVNTIILRGNNNTVVASNAHLPGSFMDAIFRLEGADYLTLEQFVMMENPAATNASDATNTVTEWGVALLASSLTNGSQNNIIRNNTISLRVSTVDRNTFGIYSNVRHSTTSVLGGGDPTVFSGTNSNNKIHSNTISNVNFGISFTGSGVNGNGDTGNELGGMLAETGNTITEFGKVKSSVLYASHTDTNFGIQAINQVNETISNNTLISNDITSSGTISGARGILKYYTADPTGTTVSTISKNLITLTYTASTSDVIGIYNSSAVAGGAGQTLNITDNKIIKSRMTATTTLNILKGISNTANLGTLNITGNLIRGCTSAQTGGTFTAIENAGIVVNSINFNNNLLGNEEGSAILFTGATAPNCLMIYNSNGGSACSLSISGNQFYGISYTNIVASTVTFIRTINASIPTVLISNNLFKNIALNTSSTVYFFQRSSSSPANSTYTITGNQIVGSFSKAGTAGDVTILDTGSSLTAGANSSTIISNNNFSNITLFGTSRMTGFSYNMGQTCTITSNILSNWTAGGISSQGNVGITVPVATIQNISKNVISNITNPFAFIGINISGTGTSTVLDSNQISGITTVGDNTGLSYKGSHTMVTISRNTICNLTTSNAIITALLHQVNSGSTTSSIFSNKIYGILSNSATVGNVKGMLLGKTSSNNGPCTVYNNYIGDLRAPTSDVDNSIKGIEFVTTSDASDYNFYHNTVYLNAVSSASQFGVSVMAATTGGGFVRLDLRNNIFVSTSTPNGPGLNTVYRGLTLTPALYKTTTNNNLVYAGVPDAKRLIYYSSVSVLDQTLGAFQARVYPRDNRSVTELPSFISTMGSSADFLHINISMPTRIESGGSQVIGITSDYDAVIRAGNMGYTGTGTLPDIGADEGEFILTDALGPEISYTSLGNTASLSNRNLGSVSITDVSGVRISAGLKPRLYFKKKTQANAYNDNTNATDGWKYVEANGTSSPFDFDLDYALLNGGDPVVGDTVQYFVIAQDTAMTPNVGFNLGIPTLTPATVELDASHFPMTNTINAYAIKAAMEGDKTVCSSGCDYPSLTNAGGIFEAINNSLVTDSLTIRIAGDLTGELGTHPLNAYAVNERILIRPFGGLHRTISGTAANGTPLIGINGADNVILDGIRAGGDSLTISNLSTSSSAGTSTIRLINGANGNLIARCRVLGSAIGTLGSGGAVIFFNQVSAGNNNNILEDCDVGAAGSNLPSVLIYSLGSSSHTGNMINGCRLFDFFAPATSSAGIYLESGTGWSLINNKFYQTAARTFTTNNVTHYGISLLGGSGSQVSNNTIGYSASNGTGLYSIVGLQFSKWFPIDINAGTAAAPIEVQGNKLSNMSYSGTMSGTGINTPFVLCRSAGGVLNVGTVNGNILGDSLVNGSITYSSSSTSVSDINGFYFSGATSIVNLRNNVIGGLQTALNGTGGANIIGIQTASVGAMDCRFNTIGGPIANSIQCLSAFSSFVRGIVHNSNISAVISDNIIRNMTSNCSNVISAHLIGIAINTTALQTISRNRIYNLTGFSTSGVATSNVGIQLLTSTVAGTVTMVEGNQIHSMETTNASEQIVGIQLGQGFNTCTNNMIRLGLKQDGTALTVPCQISGIVDELGTPKLFYNSVYIGGTGVLNGSTTSAAFRRVNSAAFEVRNNIFSNGRQNASTGGKHYNVHWVSSTGITNNLNHNVYYNTGGNGNFFGIFASTETANFQSWRALMQSFNIVADQNSHSENPFFISPDGNSTNGDLHIQSLSNSVTESRGNPINGILLDIDGQSRAATPDIGADEGTFASLIISYTRLDGTISLSNRTLGNVSITSSNGVNTSMGTKPRVYFKKTTDPNDVTGWKYVETNSAGSPFSFDIDYTLLNDGMVSPLDTIQYFVIAQDLAMTPSVAVEDGFTNMVPASVNLGASEFPITGNINSYIIRRTISGTKTICASGCDYTSLTNNGGVFSDINSVVVIGDLTVEIRDNLLAETGTHPLNAYSPGYAITIRPAGGLTRVVSGAIAGKPLIDFNGADSVLVDGRNIGGDSLFITNTSTSSTTGTSTIQFRSDSRSCTIRNCIISGSSTSTGSGTVYITSSAIATGNDNIKLIKNTIGAAGSNTPLHAIYGIGPGFQNDNLVIDSNYIKDYFIANGACAGINILNNCPNVLIRNNHFFQTVPRIKTGGTNHAAIRVASPAIITGNIIGGSDPMNSGTYTVTGVSNTKVYPIHILTAGTALSTITGNTIKNISIAGAMNGTSDFNTPFTAIYVSTGTATISGNLIGDTTTTGSITYTTTSNSGSHIMGICNYAGGNLTANHNAMGGITLTEGGTGAINFTGIRSVVSASQTFTGKHNTIGGNVPSSIQNNTLLTSRTIVGMDVLAGFSVIDSNTIRNLKSCGFYGMFISGSGHNIRHNEIYGLQTNLAQFLPSYGIYLNASGTVEGNKIHSLIAGSSSASLMGILVQGGVVQLINNMIRLGLNPDGTSNDVSNAIIGISAAPSTETNLYFNSVFIGGTVTGTSATNTYCAQIDNSIKNIRNNIFFNARSNATTGGKHYSLRMANITGMVVDHNVYHVTGTNGVLANIVSADKSSIEALRSATLQDGNSSVGDPKFINPTGTAALFDLHIDTAVETPVEGNGVAVAGYTIDYDGQVRAALSPVDIGADAGSFIGKDMILPVITYADLSADYVKTSRPLSNVLITDNASGIDTVSGLKPRLYFKKSTDPNTDTEWKYVEATGTSNPFDFIINYSLLTAGSVSVGDVIQYFVVAADTATTPNVGKNAAIFSATPSSVALMSAQFPINGTIKSYAIIDTLVGTKTVCASGCDFTSLTNNDAGGAFKAINDRILTADVLLQITSDLNIESGTVSLNAFAAPYTVTIKPDGAPRLVSYGGANSLIVLNGADRVIIDGSLSNTANTLCPLVQASRDLTFKNTAASASVINLRSQPTNPATNNVIKNCNIEGNATSTTIFGIASTDQTVTISSLGKDNDNNSFVNNSISKVQYGIYSQGETRSNKNQGTVIQLNNIDLTSTANTAVAGLYLGFENNAQISGNTIKNISNSTKTVAGIALGLLPSLNMNVFNGNDVSNSVISLNTIRDIARIGDGSSFGITMAAVIAGGSSTNELSNNMLFNINSTAATTMDYIAGILVGGGAVGTTKVLYNTIKLAGVSAYSAPGFAMVIGSGNPSIEMKNNIFVNEMTSTFGKNYALGLAYNGSFSNLNSDRNDFFTTASPLAIAGGLNNAPSGNLTNLAAYQALTGKDMNSKNALPEFVSSTDLHLTTAAVNLINLDGKGAPVSTTIDIDCDTRSVSNPDIGADEIAGCDYPTISSLSADVNPIPCSGNAANLTLVGTLNDATDWKWYKGGCGMTMEGTGTTIAVMPDAATTYYVRGEGGCVTDNTCLSISITISGALTTNTNDGGVGSLREAITCAGDGDTLAFDPGVLNMGDTIMITSGALTISKNLFIDQGPSGIVKIKTTGTHSIFDVDPGSSLSLRNVHLFMNPTSPNTQGRAVFNEGSLTLKDVEILERQANLSGSGSTIHSQAGALIEIVAGCQLKIQ